MHQRDRATPHRHKRALATSLKAPVWGRGTRALPRGGVCWRLRGRPLTTHGRVCGRRSHTGSLGRGTCLQDGQGWGPTAEGLSLGARGLHAPNAVASETGPGGHGAPTVRGKPCRRWGAGHTQCANLTLPLSLRRDWGSRTRKGWARRGRRPRFLD